MSRFSFSNESGYLVYEVPAGFDCSDGQDQAKINEICTYPLVAHVTYITTDYLRQPLGSCAGG